MTQDSVAKPTDFDALWNFNKPAETETEFRKLISESKKWGLDAELQLQTQIARTQGLQRKFEDAHKTLDEVQKKLLVRTGAKNGPAPGPTTPDAKNGLVPGPATSVAEVRYLLERGRVFNSSKKHAQALPLFIKAFELATQRKLENFAVDAAHMAAIAEPSTEKQIEWNLKAMKTAETAADPKAKKWLGSLYNNMGWTYHEASKFEDALGMFKKALAFHETGGKPENISIAKWCVGRGLRSLKKFDEALEIQKSLEEATKKAGKPVDMYVSEELGELYLMKQDEDLARKYFQAAYSELSKDEWFKANEAVRLERIKRLSEGK